jgi:hypothetical protein
MDLDLTDAMMESLQIRNGKQFFSGSSLNGTDDHVGSCSPWRSEF